MNSVLGLFAKWPRAGQVKTRLAAETSPQFAADLALAFLQDSIARLVTLDVRRVVVGTPESDRSLFEPILGPGWQFEPQSDGDLGRRLSRFTSDAFAGGATLVVVIGADSPTLPIHYVSQTFELLQDHDVVLGPACDGGYYLLGLAKEMPELFEDVSWGADCVLRQTLERLNGASLAVLPPWYDVDSIADCRFLATHIQAMMASGNDAMVPVTRALLARCPV